MVGSIIQFPFSEPQDHSNELLNLNLILLEKAVEYLIGQFIPATTTTPGFVIAGQNLTVALDGTLSFTAATFAAMALSWFNSLPTSLPTSAGILWNNGGALAQS